MASKGIIRYRTPESVMKKIDSMLKQGKCILDHGVSSYEIDRYEYEPASYKNGFSSKLRVYAKDFWQEGRVFLYAELTEKNLKKPTKRDYGEFVACYWEKQFPDLLNMREYDVDFCF